MDLSEFKVADAFKPITRADSLLHSYIVFGPDGQDKTAFINTLAAAMICEGSGNVPCGICRNCKKSFRGTHPDIIHVFRPEDKKEIPVATIREVRRESIILPNEAEKKVFIVVEADKMNSHAQNAFLKTLEEPSPHSCFILSAENPSAFLDTVRSRCAEIRITSGEPEFDDEISELAADFMAALDSSDLAISEFSFRVEKADREKMAGFISAVTVLAVDALRSGKNTKKLSTVLKAMERAKEYQKFNVSSGHIISMICAYLTDIS